MIQQEMEEEHGVSGTSNGEMTGDWSDFGVISIVLGCFSVGVSYIVTCIFGEPGFQVPQI